MRELVLISDVSRQYAQITARRVRERDIYCEAIGLDSLIECINERKPLGVILTGSIEDSYLYTDEIKTRLRTFDIPILAIGAASEAFEGAVYPVRISKADPSLIGETAKDEVAEFLIETCGCKGDFTVRDFAIQAIEQYKRELFGKKVICALSGGVDSTVAAVILHKAIGDNLINIFVDTGLMRKNEGDQVITTLRESFEMNVIRVDAERRFLDKLSGVVDPELKRKIIGTEFIDIFTEEASKHGDAEYLVQGTIYSDVLESGLDGAKSIKSHHNVGGLPEKMSLKLIEPLRFLFKDEVRRVGAALGIPEVFVKRQAFPGPGLGVRCLGELTKERLDILRECDAIVREEIEKTTLPIESMQYFAVLPGLYSVGVVDGARTYCETVAIRAVHSVDKLRASHVRIPYEVLDIITKKIYMAVPQVNRVVLDISPKPPATIEWE